jgi:hypothetical protein
MRQPLSEKGIGLIGLSYKVTVSPAGLLIQSDRASPYKLTVDKPDSSQGVAQPRAAAAMVKDCLTVRRPKR